MPQWLVMLAWAALSVGFASALAIASDMLITRPKIMPVMKAVWPITALYMGPLALWAYCRWQRQAPMGSSKPFWQSVFIGATHCGSGCALGDIIGEFGVFFAGATLGGLALWPEYIADYALAYTFGIAFQYFSIVPMRKLAPAQGIRDAVQADTLSLTAFEIGMFGWMAIAAFVLFHNQVHPNSPVHWFVMQIGMLLGFATTYPVNWWLLRAGIKEAM